MELQARIENAEKRIQRDYGKTLEKVQRIKNQMNGLEQSHTSKTRLKALNLATKRLDRLTDSQITRSKKAWEEYRKLERASKEYAQRPVQLGSFRVVCKKTEDLAADLLCYSLGRSREGK